MSVRRRQCTGPDVYEVESQSITHAGSNVLPVFALPNDTAKHYPEDLDENREVHADGEIWSRALWDINQALGNVAADKIIVGAQFSFTADTTFKAAAIATVHYAKQTNPGAAGAVCTAFVNRGFLSSADCASA